MLYCPNPDCEHKIGTGKPAEFVEGTELCSDCGSKLSSELPHVEKKEEFKYTEFYKRIVFTLVVILLYRLLANIPIPGFDHAGLNNFLQNRPYVLLEAFTGFSMISIVSFGIMPYITAYMLVEIFALFTPPLKKWRNSGIQGRLRLKITALLFTIVVGFIQSYSMAKGLESMANFTLVLNPGVSFRVITALTLIGGTFITILLAEMITSRGIGHGISILIITGVFSRGIPHYWPQIKSIYFENSLVCVVPLLLIAVLLFIVVYITERAHRNIDIKYNDGKEYSMPLKLTTAGTTPLMFVSSVILFPASVAAMIAVPWVQSLANQLSPGSFGYMVLYAIFLFIFYYFFTSVFYNSEKINLFLKDRNAIIKVSNEQTAELYMDKVLERMAFIGVIYLYLLVKLPYIMIQLGAPMFIGGVMLIKATAILLDIIGDIRIRGASEELVKVAEFHDVPKAGLLKSILTKEGIPCYLRGYYHRALLYLFGPYIEISALVPEHEADKARALIKKYMFEDYH
ncbi:MAG: DUF2007 domain-containing protein [Nitrospirota bacterium]|nr:MAG: DUF2007 domain-containing protein [Nitrospirota bacterium]